MLGVLFSSGKDSTYTLTYYQNQGWTVACLLSLIPQNPESYMFQTPLRALVEAQAAALNLPVLFQETSGEEERELEDLKALLLRAKKKYHITKVAVGALASDYQHVRVNHVCHELGLKTYAPLWHKKQNTYMREMIGAGFDIRMTKIAAFGLDASWLGKRLTLKDVERLAELERRFGFHVAGEGGEYETIVLDGPNFRWPLIITYEKVVETQEVGKLVITSVKRGEKGCQTSHNK